MKLGKGTIYLLIAISVTVFMDGLDRLIVNIALPTTSEYFGTDTGTVSWPLTDKEYIGRTIRGLKLLSYFG